MAPWHRTHENSKKKNNWRFKNISRHETGNSRSFGGLEYHWYHTPTFAGSEFSFLLLTANVEMLSSPWGIFKHDLVAHLVARLQAGEVDFFRKKSYKKKSGQKMRFAKSWTLSENVYIILFVLGIPSHVPPYSGDKIVVSCKGNSTSLF